MSGEHRPIRPHRRDSFASPYQSFIGKGTDQRNRLQTEKQRRTMAFSRLASCEIDMHSCQSIPPKQVKGHEDRSCRTAAPVSAGSSLDLVIRIPLIQSKCITTGDPVTVATVAFEDHNV